MLNQDQPEAVPPDPSGHQPRPRDQSFERETRASGFADRLESASAELTRLLSEARQRLVAPLADVAGAPPGEGDEATAADAGDTAQAPHVAPPVPSDTAGSPTLTPDAEALIARAEVEARQLVDEASAQAAALLRETEAALRARAESILAVLEPLRLALDRLDTLRALVEIAASRLSELLQGAPEADA